MSCSCHLRRYVPSTTSGRSKTSYLGRKLGPQDGFKGQLRLAKLAREQVQLDPEDAFFALLSAHERAQLVDGSAFHFCIVSARRAQVPEGARDIAVAQDAFTSSGVTPAWLRGLHMPARLKWAMRLRCSSTSREGLEGIIKNMFWRALSY